MERIVNGHYADPNSTRDLIGITPTEFSCLVSTLQNQYKQCEVIFGLSDEGIKQMIIGNLGIFDKIASDIDWDTVTNKIDAFREYMSQQRDTLLEIIAAINQPYPGADYSETYKGD